MGRGRDPFDRALSALRRRVAQPDSVKGVTLAVLPLAAELDVSSTPVREALAHLAGQGLVTRTGRSGYRSATLDRASLADLYGLVGVLLGFAHEVGLRPLPSEESDAAGGDQLSRIHERMTNLALGAAIARAMAQLEPYRDAERAVFGDQERDALNEALAGQIDEMALNRSLRAFFRRRARRAADILAAAYGLA